MTNMFLGCNAFNQDMRQWNLSDLSGDSWTTNGFGLFHNCQYFEEFYGVGWVRPHPNIVADISNGQYIPFARNPLDEAFSPDWLTGVFGNISNCNTFLIEDMSKLFRDKAGFNSDISQWNTCRVTNMSQMFSSWTGEAPSVFNNGDTGDNSSAPMPWNTSKVTDMTYMFFSDSSSYSSPFNQNIGNWDTSSVTRTFHMFTRASKFNQNIGGWDMSKVTSMEHMFDKATKFNNGDASGVTHQPMRWNTSNVGNMQFMFDDAEAFNQDISTNTDNDTWNVSGVGYMSGMFRSALLFNQNIGNWNTAAVTSMYQMFQSASAFNQDIGSWKPNPIAYADASGTMFLSATAFCASAIPDAYCPWWNGVNNNNIDTDNNDWSKDKLGCPSP
jgi:surface protein